VTATGSNPLQIAVKQLVLDVIAENAQQSQNTPPVPGTVAAVNADGTVNVSTAGGAVLQNVGAAVALVQGQSVIVITAQGVQVAIPQQS